MEIARKIAALVDKLILALCSIFLIIGILKLDIHTYLHISENALLNYTFWGFLCLYPYKILTWLYIQYEERSLNSILGQILSFCFTAMMLYLILDSGFGIERNLIILSPAIKYMIRLYLYLVSPLLFLWSILLYRKRKQKIEKELVVSLGGLLLLLLVLFYTI